MERESRRPAKNVPYMYFGTIFVRNSNMLCHRAQGSRESSLAQRYWNHADHYCIILFIICVQIASTSSSCGLAITMDAE